MTPLERAAAALEAAIKDHSTKDGSHFVGRNEGNDWIAFDGNLDITPLARAVIAAIREPSEAMIQFGREVGEEAVYCDDAGKARLSVDGPREIWTEMIDALLADAR